MTPSRSENLFNLISFPNSAILLVSTKTSRPLGEIRRWASRTAVTLSMHVRKPSLHSKACFQHVFRAWCLDFWSVPSNISVYCDWMHYNQHVLRCLLSIICILFFIFSWVDICENKTIRQLWQAEKFTFFWKHKNKTYLIFTSRRRCCFGFQQSRREKENEANYVIGKTNFVESNSFKEPRKTAAKSISVSNINLKQDYKTRTTLVCGLSTDLVICLKFVKIARKKPKRLVALRPLGGLEEK